VSERGDKGQFGRERRRKILRRKRTRELQKAPGTKQEAPQVAGLWENESDIGPMTVGRTGLCE